MFPSNSPRRQSVTYPGYQQSGAGYDYTGHGSALGPGMYADQQWPGSEMKKGVWGFNSYNNELVALSTSQSKFLFIPILY